MQAANSPRALDYARDRVADAGGRELLERLDHLDARRSALRPTENRPARPDATAKADYDVALVGGGLSLLIAPVLAARGIRVAVFERARAGQVHREWNASVPEL
ncbi:MAG: lycopene cyclase, partial [Myxococcota bacterium]